MEDVEAMEVEEAWTTSQQENCATRPAAVDSTHSPPAQATTHATPSLCPVHVTSALAEAWPAKPVVGAPEARPATHRRRSHSARLRSEEPVSRNGAPEEQCSGAQQLTLPS